MLPVAMPTTLRAGAGTTTSLLSHVRERFDETLAAQRWVRDTQGRALIDAATSIATAFERGRKLLLCGNGGSAADCQHMAAEFVSRLSAKLERESLPAIALTTDTSFITAHANDYSFDTVFSRQVEGLGKQGDVLLAISTSGASRNIREAVHAAHQRGLRVIGLFGRGAALARDVDVLVEVDGAGTAAIQECFLSIEHTLCELVEQLRYGAHASNRRDPVTS
jgi:D-sedoheptulose 7-phosphate isomerase